MRHLAAATLILAGLAYTAPAAQPLAPSDEEDLRKTALELKDAIVHEDVQGILRRVSRSKGLICTDSRISYQQVQKDLHNKNSHLYMSLFDSARFAKRCGGQYPPAYPAISEKEFFTAVQNDMIEIARVGKGWAQVVFKSKTEGHYPREWVFHKEGGQWRLSDGFIVSRCTCG